MKIALIVAVVSVLQVLSSATYGQTFTPTTAMYYNANGKLLQIEDVRSIDIRQRLLQDIGNFRIPRMVTRRNADLPSPQCPAEGQTQAMQSSASYAIYWGVANPSSIEWARPLGIEYVGNMTRSLLVCQQIKEAEPCSTGYRCLTGCAGCPSYCCVR